MKLNKLFLIAGMALVSLSFASCSDDDDYTPGKETGKYDVGFKTEDGSISVPIDATEFTFTVIRGDEKGELTVPLNYPLLNKEAFASAPSSVTFGDGETEKEVTVKFAEGMKVFKNYAFAVTIPEEYTNQYKENVENYPVLKFDIMKEDFMPWGTGVYYMWLFNFAFPVEISHSDYLGDIYRIDPVEDLGGGDYFNGFCFRWSGKFEAGQEVAITDITGKDFAETFETGVSDGTYGMTSIAWQADEEDAGVTDIDENGFGLWFLVKYTVSLGSFGVDYDGLYITGVNETDK